MNANSKVPGRYDDEAENLIKKLDAEMVIVCVLNGNKGSGFSVVSYSQEVVDKMPSVLRGMADQMDNDNKMPKEETNEEQR